MVGLKLIRCPGHYYDEPNSLLLIYVVPGEVV